MAQPKLTKAAKLANETRRLREIFKILEREYPEAHCSLDFTSPYELICATILSAQCTDERVNQVTPALFKRFPDARSMAMAKQSEVEKLVKTTGFFRQKAKSLRECAGSIVEFHAGEVPRKMEELVKLRGVGRKTANVILSNAYGLPGLPVDTHVGRLARRLGFTKSQDPVKIEHELGALLEPAHWGDLSHLLIYHGRAICTARRAYCEKCPIRQLCPKIGVAAPAKA